MPIPRSEILKNLNAKVRKGKPIIGGGAGTGISAKCEEAGGIDLIVIYNTGRYRMAGRVSITGLFAYAEDDGEGGDTCGRQKYPGIGGCECN